MGWNKQNYWSLSGRGHKEKGPLQISQKLLLQGALNRELKLEEPLTQLKLSQLAKSSKKNFWPLSLLFFKTLGETIISCLKFFRPVRKQFKLKFRFINEWITRKISLKVIGYWSKTLVKFKFQRNSKSTRNVKELA